MQKVIVLSSAVVMVVSFTPGGLFTPQEEAVMVSSSKESAQGRFEIVQRRMFAPTDNPVTVVAGLFTLAKVPVPAITLQVPVPTEGALAYKIKLVTPQVSTLSMPALAEEGFCSNVIVTVDDEAVQGGLEIVHCKT